MGISEPVLVSPEAFTAAMTARWLSLGNAPSPLLEQLWAVMASTFNHAIASSGDRWRVLQPPTGTGKTQGLCVYAALTVAKNATSLHPIGILVVTRTIQQADEIVETIRAQVPPHLADRVQAKHSENRLSVFQMLSADVLVITHAAYTLALERINQAEYGRWDDYINWEHGPRRLTIIDEALSTVVEENQVKAEHIRQLLGYINLELREAFSLQVAALETLLEALDGMDRKLSNVPSSAKEKSRQRIVWRAVHDGRISFPKELAMGDLRGAMRNLPYDNMALGKASSADRNRIAKRVDDTIKNSEAIMRRWAYYAQKGRDATLNSSHLLIPSDLPGPVVLDATATQNFLWTLLESRAEVIPTPSGARNYRNVTLNVARVSDGLGKGTMVERGKQRVPRLLTALENAGSSDRKVLVCLHKGIEHVALSFQPSFAAYSVTHWGAIDGKNDWQDYDTAVIFGMFYRDQIWSTNMFFALQGLQDNAWLKRPRWKQYANVHSEMRRRQLAVTIIQATNRVRSRRVIDAAGNCPVTEVFIILPKGEEGDAILGHITKEMPGVVVKPWSFELDGSQQRVRKGSSHEALLAFMRNRLAGETAMSLLRKELGLTDSAAKDLTKVLRTDEHDLTKALAEIGVRYVSTGRGRGGRSYLLKR